MKQKVLTIRATADIMITGKEVRAVNTNARVKAVREAAGLSQDEFARKLGFKSRGAITNIERELNSIINEINTLKMYVYKEEEL